MGDRALPALGHVGLAAKQPGGTVTAAATVDLGLTEAQSAGDGLHERAGARLAVSAYALPWLAFGILADGRYDHHPADALGSDQGGLFRSELASRASFELGQWHAGLELVGWVPGGPDVGTSFSALSVDARGLLAYRAGSLTVGGMGGYRFDRSARAARTAAQLRLGDWIALGDSDFDALLVGIGLSYAVERSSIFAETSGDFLVGRGAPVASKSPLRVTFGVRHALSTAVSIELAADALLSGRPTALPGAPLVPIEPRASLFAGLRYAFGARPAPHPAPPVPTRKVPTPAPPPAPVVKQASLELSLNDENEQPLNDAEVELHVGEHVLPLAPVAPGQYRLEQAPPGPARLHIHSAGREDIDRDVTVESGGAQKVDLRSRPALPPGQLRGLVRSFKGKPLAARVRAEPLGKVTQTDAEGFFQIDVPPGDYELVIDAPGYAEQRRKTHVEQQGVVIVNADLSVKP